MDFRQWILINEIVHIVNYIICEAISDEEHTEIIAKAKAGDRDALNKMWTYWQKEASAKVASMLKRSRDDNEVHEIVGTVITRFMEKFMDGDIRADTSEEIGAWIKRAVDYTFKERAREIARMTPVDPETVGRQVDAGEFDSGTRGRTGQPIMRPGRARFKAPDVAAMSRERDELLDAAADTLPEREKAVFDMYRSGVDIEKIADYLGLHVDTVSGYKRKAEIHLTAAMRELGLSDVDKHNPYAIAMGSKHKT